MVNNSEHSSNIWSGRVFLLKPKKVIGSARDFKMRDSVDFVTIIGYLSSYDWSVLQFGSSLFFWCYSSVHPFSFALQWPLPSTP